MLEGDHANCIKTRRGIAMEIQLSMIPQFLSTASKATIETSDSVVIFAIADFGPATGAASTQPNH